MAAQALRVWMHIYLDASATFWLPSHWLALAPLKPEL
jgi:hypothetical protein